MILREGVTPAEAADTLQMLAGRLESSGYNPLYDWYIGEMNMVENQLNSPFEPVSVAAFLDTPRHWTIIGTHDRTVHNAWLNNAVDLEKGLLAGKLAKFRDEFRHLAV